MSLREYAAARNYGQDFLDLYVIPMGSAVWSTPPEKMLDFPARTLMHFWFNHGFLGMKNRHPWWTVVDGSRQYVHKMIQPFADRIRLRTAVQSVVREPDGSIIIHAEGHAPEVFDKVIFATHAPTTLQLLEAPTALESELLSAFKYQFNIATLHTDESFMPRTRKCWAAWNYQIHVDEQGVVHPVTHYWMNLLQGVSEKRNYFVSINGAEQIPEQHVIRRIPYEHPLFDQAAVSAQKRLRQLNQVAPAQNTYFCGAWFRYGFHEDGFMSAVDLCTDLLGKDPW
jgi:uncharacterized protein